MANEEQLSILKQGVDVWNEWRKTNRIKIDLSQTRLDGVKLQGVNLHRADLTGASWRGADLSGADLSKSTLGLTDLSKATLTKANFIGAEISGTLFTQANLKGADLRLTRSSDSNYGQADLSGALLFAANLIGSEFEGAKFSGAFCEQTIFGDNDLSQIIDIETVIHEGPSTLGMDTISKSKGKIPEVFLRGCGLTDWEIESAKLYDRDLNNEEINKILYQMYDLRATQALQISPLFISYSHDDSTFVDKLESHLNRRGIRFWRDVHGLKSGRIEKQIDRAIRQNPTVLLILSEHSLKSDWVEHEVRTARQLAKGLERDVLCPVALDDRWKTSPWPKRIMEQVMEYNILDFSAWRDDSKFGEIFNKLINGLELFYK
jgi:uncharacterized protein YjbI with pentapeptide repeats